MDDSTDLTKVRRPARFRNFPFHVGSLPAILSISGWISTLRRCLVCKGNPRYVHGKVLIGHLNCSRTSLRSMSPQQIGYTALFVVFTTKPDAVPNAASISCTFVTSSLVGFKNIAASSAYRLSLNLAFRTFVFCRPPSVTAFLYQKLQRFHCKYK